jgi:hypothetical protein
MKRIVLFVLVISWALGALVIPVGAVPPEQGTSQSAGSGPRTITGTYETTNPIYPLVGGEVGIMLYDMWGEIQDDYAFHPDESVQVIGELDGDIVSGSYRIDLPAAPQGVLLDFDGDDSTPPAVQVFAAATFIEFLGDEYLNRGEEVQNLSARLAPFTWEVVGGTLIVWSANEGEWFPSGLGLDGVLFTGDEPLMLLPAGWSVVSLETDSFTISREETARSTITRR